MAIENFKGNESSVFTYSHMHKPIQILVNLLFVTGDEPFTASTFSMVTTKDLVIYSWLIVVHSFVHPFQHMESFP